MALWNLLPENKAYSFVGFVKSRNLASATLPDYLESTPQVTNKSKSARSMDSSNKVTAETVHALKEVATEHQHSSPVSKVQSVFPRDLGASNQQDLALGKGSSNGRIQNYFIGNSKEQRFSDSY